MHSPKPPKEKSLPPRYSYGEFVVLAQHDHINVCKPADQQDPAYARYGAVGGYQGRVACCSRLQCSWTARHMRLHRIGGPPAPPVLMYTLLAPLPTLSIAGWPPLCARGWRRCGRSWRSRRRGAWTTWSPRSDAHERQMTHHQSCEWHGAWTTWSPRCDRHSPMAWRRIDATAAGRRCGCLWSGGPGARWLERCELPLFDIYNSKRVPWGALFGDTCCSPHISFHCWTGLRGRAGLQPRLGVPFTCTLLRTFLQTDFSTCALLTSRLDLVLFSLLLLPAYPGTLTAPRLPMHTHRGVA